MASKQRVICGLSVAAVWLLAIFILPLVTNSYLPLVAILCAASIVCLYELCTMLRKRGYKLPFQMLSWMTIGWFGWMYWGDALSFLGKGFTPACLGVASAAILFRVLLDDKVKQPMETAIFSVASFLYIPFMLSQMIPLAVTKGAVEFSGIFLVFSLILITKMSDTGGYFIGSSFGKHKMCPRLSPGKSWEGTAGGYGFSLVVALILVVLAHVCDANALLGIRAVTATFGQTLWFFLTVIVLVTVGILGDLLESLIKRQCEVKDSSALFPAMGGFFDTFDSIIFIPVTFMFMMGLGQLIFG